MSSSTFNKPMADVQNSIPMAATIDAIKEEIARTLLDETNIERSILKTQIKMLETLEHQGSMLEILIQKAQQKTLIQLLKIKTRLLHEYGTICLELFRDFKVFDDMMSLGADQHPLMQTILKALSPIPIYLYPAAFFLNFNEVFSPFVKDTFKQEIEPGFLEGLDNSCEAEIIKNIKEAREYLTETISAAFLREVSGLQIAALSECDANKQLRWRKETVVALRNMTEAHISTWETPNPRVAARLRLNCTLMQVVSEIPEFKPPAHDETARFNLLFDSAKKRLSPEMQICIDQENIGGSMYNIFDFSFAKGRQIVLRKQNSFMLQIDNSSNSIPVGPRTESMEESKSPETRQPQPFLAKVLASLPSKEGLSYSEYAKKYFTNLASHPMASTTAQSEYIRKELMTLKVKARLLNDAKLFTFIRDQYKALDELDLQAKENRKLSTSVIKSFLSTKKIDLLSEQFALEQQFLETQKKFLVIQKHVLEKQAGLLMPASPSTSSSSHSDSSPNSSVSSNTFFAPSPTAAAQHHEDVKAFLDKMAIYHKFEIPCATGREEALIMLKMQAFACLYEITELLAKLDESHAKFLPEVSFEALAQINRGIIYAKPLLDGLFKLGNTEKLCNQVLDFSYRFVRGLKYKKLADLSNSKFYKEIMQHVSEIGNQYEEKLSSGGRSHYQVALSYEEIFIKSLKGNFPGNMQEDAQSMIGLQKMIYGLSERQILNLQQERRLKQRQENKKAQAKAPANNIKNGTDSAYNNLRKPASSKM